VKRTRAEIQDEKAVSAAWNAIRHSKGKERDKRILFYAAEGTPAVMAWVETKFRATLAAIRASGEPRNDR
jgi:ABC-type sugar transport system substrate-binding protein